LFIDPTQAITDVLDEMPRQASAAMWLTQLYAMIPILGHPRLLSVLPTGNTIETGPSAAVALALFKLERAGRLALVQADDASDAVVLNLGDRSRRIAQIRSSEDAT
jgi:hypothetical protein